MITAAGPWSAPGQVRRIRELGRGGQVFTFPTASTGWMKSVLPQETIPLRRRGVAHGRMKEKDLEDTMLKFYNKNIDILLCTTIIESGLDVPGANTLIVEDCQELGLAQMYQLRGRVGRREETAFAFFLYPEGKPVGHETLERLDAITTLGGRGAGYDLALEDLRIRGSGDLIGTSQHGTGRGRRNLPLPLNPEEEIGRLRESCRRRRRLRRIFRASFPQTTSHRSRFG